MKIAVTGGSGFLGEHLIDELMSKNYEINVLSRKTHERTQSEIIWYKGDLNDEDSLEPFLNGCEIIINCAGDISNPNNFKKNNVNGVKTLYQSSVDAGVGFFIQLSSAGIYREPFEGQISEESELYAYNEYERSKIDAEEWLFNQDKLKTIVLRPTTIYGVEMPNDSLRSLFSVILKKRFFFIGSKLSNSCYISVENVVSAIAAVIKQKEKLIEDPEQCSAYNLSDDMYYIDFLGLAAEALKVDLPIFRMPLSFILAILSLNETTFNLEIPLTKKRAKALARRSSYSSRKFEEHFSWNPEIAHSTTINDCVNSWFYGNGTK